MALYERYTTGESGGGWMGAARWKAQTFTVGNTGTNENHYISSVKLKIYRGGSPGTITIGIRTVAADGKPSGDDLCSGDYDGNSLPTHEEWIEFVFPSPTILSAGTQYAIVVRAPNGDNANYITWREDAEQSTYTGGSRAASYDGGSTWNLDTSRDFMFEEYGPAIAPEICSWIENKGGPYGINIVEIFELVDSYLSQTPPTGYTFIPTLQNIFGVIDYYLGFDGDSKTGCNFIS